MASTAYRSDSYTQLLLREKLLKRQKRELHRAAPLRAMLARHWAAMVGGGTAALGGVALFLHAIVGMRSRDKRMIDQLPGELLGTWAAAAAAYVVTRIALSWHNVVTQRARAARASDPRAELDRLKASSPLARALKQARRTLRWRLFLPLAGAAMLLPLTLHYAVALALGNTSHFGAWMAYSVFLVGHAHLVLVMLVWRYAGKLADPDCPERGALQESFLALGITAASAMIPTGTIGPILILLTGILPLPPLFVRASRCAARERALLARYAPAP